MMLKILNIILALMISAGLTACSGKLFTVHKIDVQQGNALEPEKIQQLEVGMTKEQVRFLMGSPLVADIFHPDRWDYIYHLIPGYGDTQHYHLTVHFEGDRVTNIIKTATPDPQANAD